MKLKTIYLEPAVQRLYSKRFTYPRKGRMIFPEIGSLKAILSDDAEFITFQRLIRDDLMELCPPSEADQGLYDHRAMPVSWSNASFIAGYVMNPATVPPLSNRQVVEDLGLATRWLKDSHEEIYDNLFHLMFDPEGWGETGAHFNKLSSTGAPYCISNDPLAKKAILSAAVEHWHQIGELARAGKLEEMARVYHASALHILGFRAQSSDAVVHEDGRYQAKERLVNDLEYSLSGGRRGRRFAADRSVTIRGQQVPDMFGQRLRTVWGAPGWLTYPMTCLLALARAGYFRRFEYTWEHRGSEDIRRKLLDAAGVLSLDVSQYDQSFSSFIIEEFLKRWDSILPPTTAALMRLNFHMPFMLPNPDVEGQGYTPIGDPGKLCQFAYGLPSGIAVNPDCGKMHVPFAIMCVVDDLFGDCHTREQVDQFMRGEHPRVALLNCGDDSFIKLRRQEDIEPVRAALAQCKSGFYFSMEPEDAGSFLGNVVYRDKQDELAVCPNVFSYYANWYMPERGVDHKSRRDFWATGARDRETLYLQCPEFDVVARVINDRFKQIFHARPSDYVLAAPPSPAVSDLDRMVLAKPDLINYRINPELISPQVAEQITSSITVDETKRIADVLMKG